MHGWFASYDRDLSSWKTSQRSLFEDSTEFSETLPRSGTMRNGKLYQRGTPERPTCGGDFSSLLPTPTTSQYGSNRKPVPGAPYRPSLPTLAKKGILRVPTPTANLERKARIEMRDEGPYQSLEKPLARLQPESIGGRLSPHFVRWLMGFPDGWLSSAHSVTPSCPKSGKSSGSAPDSSWTEDA